jgi:dTDP-4-dehydrorhamnose 3,5-epimerase-like enzyme
MKMQHLRIESLTNHGDRRGVSFTIPATTLEFLDRVKDVHIATIEPGSVRGNHYHRERREFIFVMHASSWTFAWIVDDTVQSRRFEGHGAAVIEVGEGVPHAIENTGSSPLTIMASTNKPFDPDSGETVPRTVIEP